MQPTFRQVPPNVPCSQMATLLASYRSSRMLLPDPVPMMVRSKWAMSFKARAFRKNLWLMWSMCRHC